MVWYGSMEHRHTWSGGNGPFLSEVALGRASCPAVSVVTEGKRGQRKRSLVWMWPESRRLGQLAGP